MQHRTQSTPKVGVDEFARRPRVFPLKVSIVGHVIRVETMQVGGQLLGRSKVIDMNVRVGWRHSLVIFSVTAHHYRHQVEVFATSTQPVDVELFGHVRSTIGILKGQIEFVVAIEHVEALRRLVSWTMMRTTTGGERLLLDKIRLIIPTMIILSVNVHLDVSGQLARIFKSLVVGTTVGHEPGHLLRLALGVVDLTLNIKNVQF